ncbi:HMA2 domain-containing protein [Mycobacterium intracellulare]|uniref:HMA2 domain-containing protein n=1 Tax=Mycobacterium intracellulare TaxID=1767 RepID=UPI00094F73E1|nr:hypothetical protein [Mycobacterium intracellulare]
MTTEVLPAADATATVVSDASGRMRLRITGFHVDAVRAVAIEETLATVPGVQAVTAYPRTASVVIQYSPQRCDTAAVLSAIGVAEHIPAELGAHPCPAFRRCAHPRGGAQGHRWTPPITGRPAR